MATFNDSEKAKTYNVKKPFKKQLKSYSNIIINVLTIINTIGFIYLVFKP